MNEEIMTIKNFSAQDETAEVIKNNLVKLAKYAMNNDSRYKRVAELSFSNEKIDNYEELNLKAKTALLKYAAEKAQIKEISTKADVINAFSNPMFQTVFNSIIVDSLQSIVLKSRPEQIYRLANVSDVEVGDSETWEIDTKGLPIAQRTSYTTNVTFLDSYATTSITITPKPYSIGTTMDYIRILANNYDMGREIARVAASLLFAQLKLIVDSIYAIANVQGTPFYQANWNAANYVQMIDDIKMLNGGADVTAYGTTVAFSKMGVLATTSYGFQSQDEMIRNGFLGRAYGVDNVVLDQFTDLSQPFTTTSANTLRTVPNDRVILLSSVGDKPVKLVREDFIRVKVKEPKDGSLYRSNYEYFMSFDAAIATQANYGIQTVNA
nr:MAG TPA: capsid protein [Caudoviricetes sp.]